MWLRWDLTETLWVHWCSYPNVCSCLATAEKKEVYFLVVNKGKKSDDSSSLGGVGGGVKEEETVYRNKVSGLSNYQNMWLYNNQRTSKCCSGGRAGRPIAEGLPMGTRLDPCWSVHVKDTLPTLPRLNVTELWLVVRGAQWQPQRSCGYTCSSPSPVCGKSLQNKRLFLK